MIWNNRYSFTVNHSASGTGFAVREFTEYMGTLEKAHRCPVCMVKAVNRLGFIKIYYKLIKDDK